MIFPPHLSASLLQIGLCFLILVSAAKNYTIDDQDSLFHYSKGNWKRVTTNRNKTGKNPDYKGGHMISNSTSSSANITYTFANVYFLATKWPYPASVNYAIDKNKPMTIDMQDHSVLPTNQTNSNATQPLAVVGKWTSKANQNHTIYITIPPNQTHAIVDAFIFEVFDPKPSTSQSTNHSSTTSSTMSKTTSKTTFGTTSISTSGITSINTSGTTSGITSGTTSSTPSSLSVPDTSSSSHSPSTQVRALSVSMAIVGTSLALLLSFLLWRFCIRRQDKNKNNGNQESPTPYHPVPNHDNDGNNENSYASGEALSTPIRPDPTFASPNSATISLSGSPASTGYAGGSRHYGRIQNNDSPKPSIVLNYDPSTSRPLSPTAPLSTQSRPHGPQGQPSTRSVMTNDPPMYSCSSTAGVSTTTLDENFNPYTLIPANTLFSVRNKPEDERSSITMPGRHEEHDGVWESGYAQPLKFVPII